MELYKTASFFCMAILVLGGCSAETRNDDQQDGRLHTNPRTALTVAELCAPPAAGQSGEGSIALKPDPDCEKKECGSPCDPCRDQSSCVSSGTPHACNNWRKCVEVKDEPAPTAEELCTEPSNGEPGEGSIALKPAADCEVKTCGQPCDPCLGNTSCDAGQQSHACNKVRACVRISVAPFPTKEQLCAIPAGGQPGEGSIALIPDADCAQRECGAACDPCPDRNSCASAPGSYACNRARACVRVQ